MQLYNSLTQRKEEFTPRDHHVSVYVCGITPYDTTHLGHAFTYHTFDVLIRYLESQGISVTYTQNVTDIDDDILRKAKEVGKDWRALGDEWTAHFIADMIALNVRPPDYYPRATDVIQEIIAIDEQLIREGVAYASNGNVYFAVDAFDRFGALSHIPREQMLPIANERGNNPDDPNKRDPLDFVLWQAKAPGEPSWPSPWGEGRPGWHIECTAMNRKYLGDTIDIHGGGGDLIFPHHECEIAQAESATGVVPFVRVWMHVAMVRMNGEKMSKSLGNLVWVSELLQRYTPDAIRLYLASHHYRNSWEWNATEMADCAQMAEGWQRAARTAIGTGASDEMHTLPLQRMTQPIYDALADDLDTPRAIIALDELAQRVLDETLPLLERQKSQRALWATAPLFGLRLGEPDAEPRARAGWTQHLQRFITKS